MLSIVTYPGGGREISLFVQKGCRSRERETGGLKEEIKSVCVWLFDVICWRDYFCDCANAKGTEKKMVECI